MLERGGFDVISVEPSLSGQCWTALARKSPNAR
jgi:hypothetical protein